MLKNKENHCQSELFIKNEQGELESHTEHCDTCSYM